MSDIIYRIDIAKTKDAVKDALDAYAAGASGLFVNGYSDNADVFGEIAENVFLPVTGSGVLTRFEDVKKLIYAGCSKVAFPAGTDKDDKAYSEAAARFGEDRVFILEGSEVFFDDISSLKAAFEKDPAPRLKGDIAWSSFKKGDGGLVPVVTQDYKTGQVLMVAYMNEEAYNETLRDGRMTYFSRSRDRLWLKGEESGHFQYVVSLSADCDLDTILAKVRQVGVACHTGAMSCFFNGITGGAGSFSDTAEVLEKVYDTIIERKENPKEGSYTNYLFDKGIDKILKKLGEESTEIVIAAKNPDDHEIIYEISDYLYHMMVLMASKNVTWQDIAEEMSKRHT